MTGRAVLSSARPQTSRKGCADSNNEYHGNSPCTDQELFTRSSMVHQIEFSSYTARHPRQLTQALQLHLQPQKYALQAPSPAWTARNNKATATASQTATGPA